MYTETTFLPARSVCMPVVLLVLVQLLALPVPADAQYRGGREMPEDDYLGRTGILYANAGGFFGQPVKDYYAPARGAAAHSYGWQVGMGGWITSSISVGVEYARIDNDRYSDRHPFSHQSYPAITWMGFQNTIWQFVVRYHVRIEKKVIPFVMIGGGGLKTSFLMDHNFSGTPEQMELVSGESNSFSYGLGAKIVLARHIALDLEMSWLEWSNRSIIPFTEIWGLFRFGTYLNYNF